MRSTNSPRDLHSQAARDHEEAAQLHRQAATDHDQNRLNAARLSSKSALVCSQRAHVKSESASSSSLARADENLPIQQEASAEAAPHNLIIFAAGHAC